MAKNVFRALTKKINHVSLKNLYYLLSFMNLQKNSEVSNSHLPHFEVGLERTLYENLQRAGGYV